MLVFGNQLQCAHRQALTRIEQVSKPQVLRIVDLEQPVARTVDLHQARLETGAEGDLMGQPGQQAARIGIGGADHDDLGMAVVAGEADGVVGGDVLIGEDHAPLGCRPAATVDVAADAGQGATLVGGDGQGGQASGHAPTLGRGSDRQNGLVDTPEQVTPYERFGGHDFFAALVRDFYVGVAADPVLRPMYPEQDLGPAEERLRLFLEQYWGGPTTYSDERGHPRLRMRHAPYAIDYTAMQHWLDCMRSALDARQLPPEDDAEMWTYLSQAAFAMVNTGFE